MERRKGQRLPFGMNLPLLLLLSSLFLNLFLLSYLSIIFCQYSQLRWTSAAAAEAEAIAAIDCSGHGRAFLDGVTVGKGLPECECNTCYGGNDCSLLMPECPADADSAILVSGWHRMSYQTTGDNFISLELERHIRLLHKAVRNAVTDGKFIVFGSGSTQLINALVYALSLHNSTSSSPAHVVATVPYYPIRSDHKTISLRKHVPKEARPIQFQTNQAPPNPFIHCTQIPSASEPDQGRSS
ncbi:hypothetical protein C4D60_Mb04t16240 [Musa balbisiana]|uniref:Alliinase C-terminal domain-containing protein n=1 Tax=Musa balbisiana TaxID=52838 RepID=A0A4S8KCE0_MUSBA|nr:hypothetical protein C4D60_Mb04t16240 [Musa balbisiana]